MHQWHVISLLIHGFLSVNARLLMAFGTAFYAITVINRLLGICRGWSGGAKVLGKLPVPGRPTIWIQ